jgi:hypothetical protein
MSGPAPHSRVVNHQSYGTILIGHLLFQLRNAPIFVITLFAHGRQISTVDVGQIQQVSAVPDDVVELGDISPIEIKLSAADARPNRLVAIHIG